MTKAQIHFSNRIEELIPPLKKNLLHLGSKPFDRRMVIVPHFKCKDALMLSLAKDPEWQIAAGIQIVPLSEALSKIAKKPLPSTLELSLLLQYHLIDRIEDEPELRRYFEGEAREMRIGPFCDALARIFLCYSVYGKPELPPWQERLFREFDAVLPQRKKAKGSIHLFGFSFLPKSYLDFFVRQEAHFYLFSPCAIFWGDFYSDREIAHFEKSLPESQLDLFVESFTDQNPLLSNLGRVGRQMLEMAEDIPSQEYYIEGENVTALEQLQSSVLHGSHAQLFSDDSIRCLSASNPLREVEVLKNTLFALFEKKGIEPKDVQVLAPDISRYAPYIQSVFSDLSFSISDLPLRDVDPIARGFARLIALPKERFSVEAILQLLPAMRQEFDVGIVRKWLKEAHVRWGFSKKQRELLYLEESDHLSQNAEEGTWEWGLQRMILGLGQLKGEKAPLPIVSVTDMELLDRLFTTIQSLCDDLLPLHDGTRWAIPVWLRYFACLFESYFPIDPSHDLYKKLLQLASSCDLFDQKEVPFQGVERILTQLLSSPIKGVQAPHLQSVQFSSLSAGAILPGKVVYLMGLQEEAFPRREENLSLARKELDSRPTKTDEDRYLFLQALLSARGFFFASYIRDEEGKLGASSCVQELRSQVALEITHHPAQPHDEAYFTGRFQSYDLDHYKLAVQTKEGEALSPLIPEFYEPTPFTPLLQKPKTLDFQKLQKFAKHPLRYYLHEVLGIYPSSDFDKGEEYLLSPLEKKQIVFEALEVGLEPALKAAQTRGAIPANLLGWFAKLQVEKEVAQWKAVMEAYEVESFSKVPFDFPVGETLLKGAIEIAGEKAVFVWGENTLADRIRFWPMGLIAKQWDLPMIGVKDGNILPIEGSLESYVEYFLLSETHPSLLLPAFAKALIEGSSSDLQKEFSRFDDEIWNFLLRRDPIPNAAVIHDRWSDYVRAIFGGVDAAV